MTIQHMTNDNRLVSKLMSGRTGQMKQYIAILLVSVGKENFEGEKLKAAIKMINQEFQGCCIAIADTLQRYNIATEKQISAQEAYDESLAKGDQWLEKYESYFANTLNIPYEIIRWDSLISIPDFARKEKKFSDTIESNSELRQAMESSIGEYGERLQKRLGEEQFKQILLQHEKHCFSYLQEECIAISFLPQQIKLADKYTPSTIIYPGKSTAILTANWELLIKREFHHQVVQYGDFLNWLTYRFNKVKNCALTQSLKIDECEAPRKEKLDYSEKINYVNQLSEAQLYAIHNMLDDKSLYEFNSSLLNYLLEKNTLLSGKPIIDTLDDGPQFSSHMLAYVFSEQMRAVFSTLEREIANQCKANIVRILKRTNEPLSALANKSIFVSMEF